MSAIVGAATVGYGATALAVLAADGVSEDGPSVPKADCTLAGDNNKKYEVGDVIDDGEFTCTVVAVDDTVNIPALVGTTEATTTITYHSGATRVGPASMLAASRVSSENSTNVYSVTIAFKDATTFTPVV